ncbi:lysozyme [Phenylobacterium sp.]|uniref:lysozyme n=1 Tax=Phenylobacterium sp. TaxID=1871053 RepID=UPI002730640C|nr:glycoside hydrolase family protein [Phenylobacterium sp.]MDP2214572.1 glycoside hydrolase family protein [Phenylobacterium sp.]
MKPRHQISRAAIELIERFEGYRSKAARLADGRWTIGYGHTLTAREGAEVSEEDAEALLLYDLIAVARVVNESTYAPLTQNQFDALCCFAFNIGIDNFRRSTVLRRINEGQLLQAACAMELWRKADFEGERIVIDALVRRRAAEKTLFLTPMDGWVPAPSPVLRPNIDADIAGIVPRQTPLAVRAVLDGLDAVAERDPTTATLQPAPPEEDAAPSPAQAAAAAVSYRLQAIFRDPEPSSEVSPQETMADAAGEGPTAESEAAPIEPAVAGEQEAAPESVPDERLSPSADDTSSSLTDNLPSPPDGASESEPAKPATSTASWAPAVGLMSGGAERAFVLTPSDEDDEESAPEVRSPEVRNLPGPMLAANDPLEAPAAPPEVEAPADDPPRLLIDDTAPEPSTMTFEPMPKAVNRADLGALLTLAGLGLALFAGGLFWAFNARITEGGLINPLTVGWIAGITGVGFFGVAAYQVLQRLSGDDGLEDQDDHPN